jgi:hypothetical protein
MMRRCTNCQYDNLDDAVACARCGHAFAPLEEPRPSRASGLPDWLASMQPARAATASVSENGQHNRTQAIGSVTDASSLPVQVRRSRVPLLAPDRPAAAVEPVMDSSPMSASAAPLPAMMSGTPAVADAMSSRRTARTVILALAILVLAILVYLLLKPALSF